MIDHISLAVSDLDRSRRFYDAALGPLGIRPVRAGPSSCAYELDGSDDFSIHAIAAGEGAVTAPRQSHFAFKARDRSSVDSFYRHALQAGGRDDGAPGLRPEYHAGYYAAFVVDPDGHRIEAVFHQRRPE